MNWYFVTLMYLTAEGEEITIEKSIEADDKADAILAAKGFRDISKPLKQWLECTAQQHHPVDSSVDEDTEEHVDERIFTATHLYDIVAKIIELLQRGRIKGNDTIEGKPWKEWAEDYIDELDGD